MRRVFPVVVAVTFVLAGESWLPTMQLSEALHESARELE